mgnify:CR=1 FL=1
MALITFSQDLNVSIQPGDILYFCIVVNNQAGSNHPNQGNTDTSPKKYGTVDAVDYDNKSITVTPFSGVGSLNNNHFLFFSKDKRVNTSGVVGYFAETEYRNYSKLPAEMFATSANYVESSK